MNRILMRCEHLRGSGYEQNSDEVRASKKQKYQRNSVTNRVSKRSENPTSACAFCEKGAISEASGPDTASNQFLLTFWYKNVYIPGTSCKKYVPGECKRQIN